ncbi:MAG: hypothetical protein Q4C87_10755 [Actinomycetaceae bacterium]|nr:hypothetical protein [Actinomycetaceae bacterium]
MDFTRRTLIIPDAIRPLLTDAEIVVFEEEGLPYIEEVDIFTVFDEIKLVGEESAEVKLAGGEFVAFGYFSEGEYSGIHIPTHEVRTLLQGRGNSCFCNSDILCYVRALELFLSGLPYRAVDEDRVLEELDPKARLLIEKIGEFDPPAIEHNTFWDETYWAIGESDWDLVNDGI